MSEIACPRFWSSGFHNRHFPGPIQSPSWCLSVFGCFVEIYFWFVWMILYFYLSGIWRLLALLWSAKNGTQNMGWWKRAKLLSGLQDISAFDYKQACHNRGSPRSEENLYISHWRSSWIPTEKLKTRTNVSAFKPSWTYVCDGWQTFEKMFQTTSSPALSR